MILDDVQGKSRFSILLKKYIYILLILEISAYTINLIYPRIIDAFSVQEGNLWLHQGVPYIIHFALNIICVIMMVNDYDQKKQGSFYGILCITFFSLEAGIAIFLIYMLYHEMNMRVEGNREKS